jgi:hypothetical protein
MPTGVAAIPSGNQVADGTSKDCPKYVVYVSTGMAPDFNETEKANAKMREERSNRCSLVAAFNGVQAKDFLTWNPSLASQDAAKCMLAKGNAYCIKDTPPSK